MPEQVVLGQFFRTGEASDAVFTEVLAFPFTVHCMQSSTAPSLAARGVT